MRLNIEYKLEEAGLHISIKHRSTLIDEAVIKTKCRTQDEIDDKKILFVEDFCNAHKEISEKDVLKAFSLNDDVFLKLYKERYPVGGYRAGGGRPKSSDRTEQFTQRITPDEKEFLIYQLKRYRERAAAGIKLTPQS